MLFTPPIKTHQTLGSVSQRITSKIGSGFALAPVHPLDDELDQLENNQGVTPYDNYEAFGDALWDMMGKGYECTGLEPENVSFTPGLACMEELAEERGEEHQIYFYHPDHIGSSSFITDASGDAHQHLQYLPYGESFISQRLTWATRYTFSAKEKDKNTGYNYFGARYYDSENSVWLSVDPMSDERLWVSPYSYCQNSPVIRTDPTGALDWIPPNEKGGKWTAEAGDGAWQLYEHRENSASWDEVKQAVKNLNFKRGESNEFMVHPGDKVTLPGSGSNSGESTSSGINYTPTKEHQNLAIPENYDSGNISQYEPSWVDEWSESNNFFAGLSYGIIDDAYVYTTSIIFGPNKSRHLNGTGATRKEITNSGLNTITNFAPVGSIGKFLKIENKVLNASKYGAKYKGTGALRVPHSSRGLNIRKHNNIIRENNQFNKDYLYFNKASIFMEEKHY